MASYKIINQKGIKQIVLDPKKSASKAQQKLVDYWNMVDGVGQLTIGAQSPTPRVTETRTHHYTYSRSGKLERATKKLEPELYQDWLDAFSISYSKKFGEKIERIAPLSDYEIALGITKEDTIALLPCARGSSCHNCKASKRCHCKFGQSNPREDNLRDYTAPLVERKTEELRQRVAEEEAERELAEQLRLREEAQQRPNPKEESIASVVEISEPTPVSYLPLGIVAVVVIGVVLLLRRRA